jgi:glycosyltransferase involved in cell wall biosynthesis
LEKNNRKHPKVSVIIPVKNGAPHIKDLLDSLMQVNYEKDKLEILVVDGNSTDGTREIVAQYPVKLLTEERPGINAARNTGLKYSNGEIVAFTDYDCVVPKNWVSKIVDNFENPKVGCIGGNVLGYHNDFLSQYADKSLMPVMRVFKKRETLNMIKPPLRYPAGCNMAFKREIIEKIGMFNEKIKYGFDEDEFVERICMAGYTMVLDPEIVVKHEHRPTLKGLLKQTFNYGRGMGNMLKIKGLKSVFSKWALYCILGFLSWIVMIFSFLALSFLAGSIVYKGTLLFLLLFPLVGLVIFYAYRKAVNRNVKHRDILIYPFLDIARMFVFISGTIYQIFQH